MVVAMIRAEAADSRAGDLITCDFSVRTWWLPLSTKLGMETLVMATVIAMALVASLHLYLHLRRRGSAVARASRP